jgi:two-component system phosphate regulon sensor histidine kinase PhoR
MLVGSEMRLLASNAALKSFLPTTRVGDALTLSVRSPDILDAIERVLCGGPAEPTMWREAVPVERIFDIWVSPVDLPDQEPMAAVTFRDLTDARRLERTRTDFIANVSHELRTPLASLIGFIETLKGPARDDINARERFLSIMNEQAGRMSRLIDDLLSLSRVEQHEHLRPKNKIDLVAVVAHTIDGMRLIARQRGMKIKIRGAREIMVLGDRDELIRLVENLIGNAIKYGSTANKDSLLDVSVDILASNAWLCVRDYGPGIAKEHLPRLTERFYRADGGSSGGTGLGLALVKHIVARHRGRLTISSEPGEGACFEVTLPLA